MPDLFREDDDMSNQDEVRLLLRATATAYVNKTHCSRGW